jgi:hypothetical protein
MRTSTAVLLLLMVDVAGAADPCAAPERHQFDFWIGDWTVTKPDGTHAGDNRIEAVLGGCALHESWRGAKGGTGFSYNAWSDTGKAWHQTWVDSTGGLLLLEGGLRDGNMVLADEQGKVFNRITWTPKPDGTVRQLWESSEDRGKTWKTVFDGLYRRKKP